MTGIERRIEELEKKTGAGKALTLEVLVSASWGDPEALRELAAAAPDDPLIRLVREAGRAHNGSPLRPRG